MKSITSVQNSLIKDIIQLQEKAKSRKKHGLFVIEGKREIELAIKGGYDIENILFCNEVVSESFHPFLSKFSNQTEISKEVYQKIAYRESTEGIIAIAKTKNLILDNIKLSKNPLVLVLESLEKPGNIGAILRTADAAKVDAVIIADAKTDLYNPNIVRSSVGCLFTNQIAVASSQDSIDYLKNKNINIYCATLQDSYIYAQENFTEPTALVVGTEATGLTEIWRKNSLKNINIPMQGVIDSMNVSVAAAILTFEAKRQRNFLL
jgi:RNA methyltransferase, TrmH family